MRWLTATGYNWFAGHYDVKNPAQDAARFNTSTPQVEVHVMNLGPLDRQSYVSASTKVPKSVHDRLLLLLRFLIMNSCHVLATIEGVCRGEDHNVIPMTDHPEASKFLAENGLIGKCVPEDPLSMHKGRHVCCHVKGDSTASVKVLREYLPSDEKGNWQITAGIFQVKFGTCSTTGDVPLWRTDYGVPILKEDVDPADLWKYEGWPVIRAPMSSMKICAFRLNSVLGKTPDVARKLLYSVACVTDQVELFCGDGNKMAYRFCANQDADLGNSALSHVWKQVQYAVNSDTPLSKRLSVHIADNNRIVDVSRDSSTVHSQHSKDSYDCAFRAACGFGKAACQPDARANVEKEHVEACKSSGIDHGSHGEKAIWTSSYPDHEMKVSEVAKYVTQRDLWLKDGDTDWHIPFRCTIRQYYYKALRQRKHVNYRDTYPAHGNSPSCPPKQRIHDNQRDQRTQSEGTRGRPKAAASSRSNSLFTGANYGRAVAAASAASTFGTTDAYELVVFEDGLLVTLPETGDESYAAFLIAPKCGYVYYLASRILSNLDDEERPELRSVSTHGPVTYRRDLHVPQLMFQHQWNNDRVWGSQ